MQPKKILILGGTSYLGSQMYKFLKNEKHVVTATYNSNKVSSDDFKKCNLLEKIDTDKFSNYDFVFLYSFFVVGKHKLKKNKELINNVVEYVNKTNSHLIFISSSQVKFSYETEYKMSKLYAEKLIKDKVQKYLIVRPSLPVGNPYKNFFKPKRNQPIEFLSTLIKKIRIVPIIGDGKQTRQPIYVEDLNLIIYKIMMLQIKNKVIEIGGPEKISFNEIIKILSNKFNKKCLKINVPLSLIYPFTYIFKFIDKENIKNSISSEDMDNNSWKVLDKSLKDLKLKNFSSVI
tara:strand:+ start:134 stop:1000 length:867 start_codon:yes stop_codon:yes gene_type:complete